METTMYQFMVIKPLSRLGSRLWVWGGIFLGGTPPNRTTTVAIGIDGTVF